MALIKCKECAHEVSKKAEACPSCGAPIKAKPTQYGCGTVILLCVIIGVFTNIFSSNDSSKTPPKPKVSDSECKKTLQCWGDRHSISAATYCESYIEKMAKYSHKWTDGMLEPKFSHFRWKNKEAGIVTFIGDKIQFQNGFGAWQNYTYECDYEPSKKMVLDVRASGGRI